MSEEDRVSPTLLPKQRMKFLIILLESQRMTELEYEFYDQLLLGQSEVKKMILYKIEHNKSWCNSKPKGICLIFFIFSVFDSKSIVRRIKHCKYI